MAQLVDSLFRGDSWDFPVGLSSERQNIAIAADVFSGRRDQGVSCAALLQGMQTTEILHTNSEDCSAESPVQAKTEEQSPFTVSSVT